MHDGPGTGREGQPGGVWKGRDRGKEVQKSHRGPPVCVILYLTSSRACAFATAHTHTHTLSYAPPAITRACNGPGHACIIWLYVRVYAHRGGVIARVPPMQAWMPVSEVCCMLCCHGTHTLERLIAHQVSPTVHMPCTSLLWYIPAWALELPPTFTDEEWQDEEVPNKFDPYRPSASRVNVHAPRRGIVRTSLPPLRPLVDGLFLHWRDMCARVLAWPGRDKR